MGLMLSTDTCYFADLQEADLDAVMAIETACYTFPWSRGNFVDSITAGYRCQALWRPVAAAAPELLAYTISMRGVDEAHLLNIAVAAAWRGQKLGVLMLDQLCAWARLSQLDYLWLEVRRSNLAAQKRYLDYGMYIVGERKNYYRTESGNENALVMSYQLQREPD